MDDKKKSKALRKRFTKSRFRSVPDIRLLRIGDTVSSVTGFPMQIVGIFQSDKTSKNGTLYLDFDGNEGDVWEEELVDIEMRGGAVSVLWKKLARRLS